MRTPLTTQQAKDQHAFRATHIQLEDITPEWVATYPGLQPHEFWRMDPEKGCIISGEADRKAVIDLYSQTRNKVQEAVIPHFAAVVAEWNAPERLKQNKANGMSNAVPRQHMNYWGAPQHKTPMRQGAVSVNTAGHGGYIISEAREAALPEVFRQGHTYEEDCDWAIVGVFFPEDTIKSTPHLTMEKMQEYAYSSLTSYFLPQMLSFTGATPATVAGWVA